jgi:hypothetical protein
LDTARGKCIINSTADNISIFQFIYQRTFSSVFSHKTTLFLVMTHKAGTTPGNPYVVRFTDGFGNLCTRDVERLDVISIIFQNSTVIDSHNQCQQSNLALEKSG